MHLVELHIAAGTAALTRLTAAADVLDAEEQTRAARLRMEADRLTYSAAHVLLRRALSRWCPIAPAQWRFSRSDHGRPEVDTGALPAATGLRFNLSHTRGLVCCAVTRHAPVGVDVECLRPIRDRLALAQRFFTADEAAAIAAAGRRGARAEAESFYAFWTLKEAYVKARGLGIAMGLDRFAFRLDAAAVSRIALQVDAESPAPAEHWRCLLLRLDGGRCQLALALAAAGTVQVRPILHAGAAAVPAVEQGGATPRVELLPVQALA